MFYGQISVRNTEKQHLPDFFISGFPRDFNHYQNLHHFLNLFIVEFLMGLLIPGAHSEKLSELKARKISF